MADINFILKNVAATEHHLCVTEDFSTLGDLRQYVFVTYQLPFFQQRYVCAGKSFHAQDDSYPLRRVLENTHEGPNQERIIWLVWMNNDDYHITVHPPSLGRGGGLALQSEIDEKRQRYERDGYTFHVMRLELYARLCQHISVAYEQYQDERRAERGSSSN